MSKKEMVFASILTILLAFMDISGIPMALFVNINVLDINPIYFALMLNFIFMGIIALLFFRYLCPNFKLNLGKNKLVDNIKKYSLPGFITGIITCIAFVMGLNFDSNPTIFKVIIEGIIYYIGVAIIEELYVRGLLLNLIEKFFSKNKNQTMLAIIISSTILGLDIYLGF